MPRRIVLTIGDITAYPKSCQFNFDGRSDDKNKRISSMFAGKIRIYMPMPPGKELMGWAADDNEYRDGKIEFKESNEKGKNLKTLIFERGFIEDIDLSATEESELEVAFTISAEKLTFDDELFDNKWPS